VGAFDLARDLIHHLLAQAMAGPPVDLVEMGLFCIARGGIEGDRAGDEKSFK